MKHTGWRKPTPGLGVAEQLAQAGERVAIPKTRAFVALKRVGAHIGLKAGDMMLLDTLGAFTQAQDWEEGQRPIVWASNAYLMEQTGFSLSALKRHARRLAEIGVISFQDSPNGKRWGRRDAEGRIVEAYGFDLSPLSARVEEFEGLHTELQAERELCQRLKRQITVARRMIRARIEAALSSALRGPCWTCSPQRTCRSIVVGQGWMRCPATPLPCRPRVLPRKHVAERAAPSLRCHPCLMWCSPSWMPLPMHCVPSRGDRALPHHRKCSTNEVVSGRGQVADLVRVAMALSLRRPHDQPNALILELQRPCHRWEHWLRWHPRRRVGGCLPHHPTKPLGLVATPGLARLCTGSMLPPLAALVGSQPPPQTTTTSALAQPQPRVVVVVAVAVAGSHSEVRPRFPPLGHRGMC